MKKMFSEEEIKGLVTLYRHNITFNSDIYTYGVIGSVISSTSKPFETGLDIYKACKGVTIPVVCYSASGDIPTTNAVNVDSDGSIRINSNGIPPSPLPFTSITDKVYPV